MVLLEFADTYDMSIPLKAAGFRQRDRAHTFGVRSQPRHPDFSSASGKGGGRVDNTIAGRTALEA